MSLRSLYQGQVVSVLTGLLEREISPTTGRFRPGGYDRAVAALRERIPTLSRYDRMLLREKVGPAVRDAVRAGWRQRDEGSVPGRSIPTLPGYRDGGRDQIGYRVRYREQGDDGSGRRDVVFTVYFETPQDSATVEAEALRMVNESQVSDTVTGAAGFDPIRRAGGVVVLAVFRTA